MGLIDRTLSATVSVDAIQLKPNVMPSDLFDVATGGASALDHATKCFARAIVGH